MTEAAHPRLHAPGPKRILALDGGGTRGITTIAFLEEIERQLAEATGRGSDFRLCEYFDLIGGTSVGAMIATMLAMGERAADIRPRFLAWAPEIFDGRGQTADHLGRDRPSSRAHRPGENPAAPLLLAWPRRRIQP